MASHFPDSTLLDVNSRRQYILSPSRKAKNHSKRARNNSQLESARSSSKSIFLNVIYEYFRTSKDRLEGRLISKKKPDE